MMPGKSKVGKGQSLNWPVGLGGKGNEGVSWLIKQTPGAIGYVELAYAIQNKMPVASLKNKSGNFVAPTLASTSASANVDIPADMRVSSQIPTLLTDILFAVSVIF